jgi:hypothetical protein
MILEMHAIAQYLGEPKPTSIINRPLHLLE